MKQLRRECHRIEELEAALKHNISTVGTALDRIEELETALRIIAGYEQCADNLMSNVDIARSVLNKETG